MAETYTAHNVFLPTADIWSLIIEFQDEDVNDKLALLASEKGLIYKTFYEDFVINICMVSAGGFFYHIRKRPELLTKFAEIRKEVLDVVYRYSSSFKPENIYINQNNLLKTEASVKPGEIVRRLVDNDLWNQDPPLSNFGPVIVSNAPEKDTDNPFLNGEAEEMFPDGFSDVFDFGPGVEDIDVPYDLIGHHWKRVGLYVNVRKYEESQDNLVSLIGNSPFDETEGYHLLIVERCVEDYADVVQVLESMGISAKIPAPQMLAELYDIAITYNPFLKMENVDMKELRQLYKERAETKGPKKTAQAGADSKATQAVQKKRFSDISRADLKNLRDNMKKSVIGQDEAVDTLVDAVHRAWIGLKREHEPNGVFLFMGNTGMGKTECVKVLAKCLDAHLTRIDCQDYQQSHEVAKLAGSPNGYVGYEDGGHLTKEVAKYPFSVVLFDEIEKAHSAFHERVLQIFDDGYLTDNKGNKVSFKDTIIIMTSNIGVKEVANIGKTVGFGTGSVETEKNAAAARKDALKAKFKPEFINRVDEVINFRKLEREDYLKILDLLLDEVSQQVRKIYSINLKFKVEAKNFLLAKGIDPKFGARPLRRAVKKYVDTTVARAIIGEEIKEGATIQASLSEDKESLVFKPAKSRKKEESV